MKPGFTRVTETEEGEGLMRSQGRALSILGLWLMGTLIPGLTWAGGLILYEINAPITGTASAGWAANAQDASTAFTNPAGMTRLDRSQLLVGAQPLIISSEFRSGDGTRVLGGGDDTGDASSVMPSLSGYYVHSFNDRVKVGISSLSYFGLGIDYGNSWVGRYHIEQGDFITATLSPSVGYKVTDWLSVGAMFNVVVAYLKSETGVNNIREQLGDGQVSLKDYEFGFGGGAGILIEPSKNTRIGVAYYSPVELTFEDNLQFDGLGRGLQALLGGLGLLDSDLKLKFTIPQWVMVSAYQQVTDDFALMANVGWQNWSQFGKVDIGLQLDTDLIPASRSVTKDLNLKDTWHFAIGGQYRIAKPWLLSAGFAYDTSPMSIENRSPALPLDRNFRYSGGIQYDWSQNLTLGLAYTFIDGGSAKLDVQGGPVVGSLQGDYDPNSINVVNVNLIYRF